MNHQAEVSGPPADPLNEVGTRGRAAAALVLGAAMWGSIWYPFRLLDAQGVGGLWAMFLAEVVATLVCVVFFRRQLSCLRWSWVLVGIGFFAGLCNVAFIVGLLKGEVMRVTLLMYLSPLWTVMLARWLLGERLNRHGAAVIVLALAGALVMLWHPGFGAPWPSGPADWLGLLSGVAFATYNVLVRKAENWPVPVKSLVALGGTVVVAGLLLPLGIEATPVVWSGSVVTLLLVTGGVLFVMAPLVQYGLVRMPANRAIVILLSELVFAALTAWWLAGETMGVQEWIGGGLIALAAFKSSRMES
ncbi:MAG TPA: DMT family transporter [Rhodocyclaceae bacterium]|nr:DMT family transporter [Rhodocyclaceae bacterium]